MRQPVDPPEGKACPQAVAGQADLLGDADRDTCGERGDESVEVRLGTVAMHDSRPKAAQQAQ